MLNLFAFLILTVSPSGEFIDADISDYNLSATDCQTLQALNPHLQTICYPQSKNFKMLLN